MNLVLKHSGGSNLVVRPQARPAWYPAERSRPAQVEVFWHYEDEAPAAARSFGKFAPGQAVTLPANPLVDRNIVLRPVSISNRGIRSVRDIADAAPTVLVFQRETAAPTLEQIGPVTHALITIAVSGFTSLAIKRRVRTADNEAMTTNLDEVETILSAGDTLPRVIYLDRSDSGTGTRDVWVQVSHSSGGAYGAENDAQMFTWADDTGAGGGDGGGDPFGGGHYVPPLP